MPLCYEGKSTLLLLCEKVADEVGSRKILDKLGREHDKSMTRAESRVRKTVGR